ncbi:MAG TPA: hypothetical protein VGM88_24925 [Kofleriaceae bacterium]|jgi:hypothetical protein
MSETHVLVVTSSDAPGAVVVPVLAAIEAAGIRVRAIDLGSTGSGVADRVRRALLGEGAARRLRKELEMSPPDAAIAFDPHAAAALVAAREQVPTVAGVPAPVVAVVGELDPVAAWAQADCDRFVAVDEPAAVALADAGIDGDRVLVAGAIGERLFAEAASQDRAALRTRFKLAGKVALVEVAGLGAEATGALAMQLSLLDGGDSITWLFDAGNDADAAAVLRRQVPALGLKAKLFGATPDAALLWRAADILIARPRAEVIGRTLLVSGRLVALIDDTLPGGARAAAALEARKRGIAAKGLLLLSSALDAAFGTSLALPAPLPPGDGADAIADIIAAIAADKRGIIDERRAAAQAATRDRVRAASAAASAAAATGAAAGDLEDLGGASPFADADIPDAADVATLRAEVQASLATLTKSMSAARDAAARLDAEAKSARGRGDLDGAAVIELRADAERARMHSLLAEMATLETELRDLEKSAAQAQSVPRVDAAPRAEAPRPRAAPKPSLDDALNELKKQAGGAPPRTTAARPPPASGTARRPAANVDDELAALKRKMASAPPKKK